MNRRKVLLGAVSAAVSLSGCGEANSGSELTQTTETGHTTNEFLSDDPNMTLKFKVLGHECIRRDADLNTVNVTDLTHDRTAQQVTIEGYIADGATNKTAYLKSIDRVVESNELILTIFTTEKAGLGDCPTRTQYRIRIEYKISEFKRYRIRHNGKTVDTFAVNAEK